MNQPSPVVQIETRDGIAILSMARGERRNAMDQALIDELKNAFLALDADPSVGAMVLRGAQHGFSAGSDLKFISQLSLHAMARFEQETGDMARLIGQLSKPVVASVENFAIGGGFILAICCDIVVAGNGSRWSLPEVPHGWLTPWGIGALVQRVGNIRARNLCFCLETLDGEQARQIGLVDHAVPDGSAQARAEEIALHLARLPPQAVSAAKLFFSNYILRDAEVMDIAANRLFAENCAHPQAIATLNKHRTTP
ncbi:enoyl-CoA hydratase/isomerase family protein [Paracandidimonas soli]|uniref:enoyl-CoA hydratase/isomerase family protein n=1 Tax=Paracandidimonas soli TaxID=1917182 RepID=UPI00333F253F